MLKTWLRNAVPLLALTAATAVAAPVPDYPFVHVTGSAFVTVVPDIASLDFEIVAVDADPASARAVVEARVGEVRALMRQLALGPGDATVREVRQTVRKRDAAEGAAVGGRGAALRAALRRPHQCATAGLRSARQMSRNGIDFLLVPQIMA